MSHIPEDENFDEYMNASAEEWSKPENPPAKPDTPAEQTDRWGSPLSDKSTVNDANRRGSEPLRTTRPDDDPLAKKSSKKWWIIAIVAVVVLCLCACIVVFGLPLLGLNLFQGNLLQF